MFDPVTLLAAFVPVLVEAGKSAVSKYLTPDQVKPTTVAEVIQLAQLDLQRFQAMQGGNEPSYPWVAAIRQLQRPVFVAGVMLAWAWHPDSPTVGNMTAAVGFYLFGDRTLFYARRAT